MLLLPKLSLPTVTSVAPTFIIYDNLAHMRDDGNGGAVQTDVYQRI